MRGKKIERKPRARRPLTEEEHEERVAQRSRSLARVERKVEKSYKNQLCIYCGTKKCNLKRYDAGHSVVEACATCTEKWDSGEKPLPEPKNNIFTPVASGGLPSLGKRS